MTAKTGKVVKLAGGEYRASRFNATRHGILSRHAVLPWEDRGDYDHLLAELVKEYSPKGPTERHLVETLATIMWRQQRVMQAEAASYAIGIRKATASHANTATDAVSYRDMKFKNEDVDFPAALTTTDADTAIELEEETQAANQAFEAFKFLGGYGELKDDSDEAYQTALAMLAEGTQGWYLNEDEPETAAALHAWLRDITADLQRRLYEIRYRAEIRTQTVGTAMDPDKIERVARYETHLDRKLERTIALLVKLQDMRRTIPAPTAM